MSTDEVVRALSYAVMIAGFSYIGVRVWNAVMMPEMLRRPVAVLLWLQGAIYALIMVGLLLSRLWHSVPVLLLANTCLIAAQATVCVYVIAKIFRRHALRLLAALVVAFLMRG